MCMVTSKQLIKPGLISGFIDLAICNLIGQFNRGMVEGKGSALSESFLLGAHNIEKGAYNYESTEFKHGGH